MPPITISLIQTSLYWEEKIANLQMLEEKINSIKERTEIVVLPEMFSTGFTMKAEQLGEPMGGTSVEWMKRVSKENNIIITGSLIIKEDGKFFNRLIWMLPTGQSAHYDKRHLFAFGDENNHYAAGDKRLIASVKGWKINLQVCYDLRFPVWARQSFNFTQGLEYDVLIYVANWPERRNLAWKTLLQARAIENQSFVVGVNRVGNDGNNIYHSGDSMVVDPLGEILYHRSKEEDVFTITLQKEKLEEVRNKFPFWKDADEFKITP